MRKIDGKHPERQERPIFNAAIEGDRGPALAGSIRDRLEILGTAHTKVTGKAYAAMVTNWRATAKRPRFGRPYTDLAYQSMLEFLAYIRAKGFRNNNVSGVEAEFMRAQAEKVIGSTIRVRYEERDGVTVLIRLAEVELIDDRAGKAEAIHRATGRRPIAALGNSGSDFEMLQWAKVGDGRRLDLIVLHTDADREWGPTTAGQGSAFSPSRWTLLRLPPYAPELNPIENLWHYLRSTTGPTGRMKTEKP